MTTLPLEVQHFLSENSLATIATLSPDSVYPYVLPVFYVVDDNLNLCFATHKEGQKIKNIEANPHVGISITDTKQLTTLQLQGEATVANQDPKTIQKIIALSTEKSENSFPPLMKIHPQSMQVVTFSIHLYKLANYSGNEPTFTEGSV